VYRGNMNLGDKVSIAGTEVMGELIKPSGRGTYSYYESSGVSNLPVWAVLLPTGEVRFFDENSLRVVSS
jgi:hypothetical protein